jgi:hypothetical protein
MTTLSGRLSDASDALRNFKGYRGEIADEYVDVTAELIDAADAMTEATPIEKIADALRDANGMSLTTASLDVLVAVLQSINRTDEKWSERGFPGAPSTTDYAAAVAAFLELRYPIKGAML